MHSNYLTTYKVNPKVNIDNKDRKILYELSTNCRQSNSQIGKKINLSKQSVSKRVRNLESSRVIFNYGTYVCTFNDSTDYFVLLKLKSLDKKEIEHKLESLNFILSIKWGSLNYDLILTIVEIHINNLNSCVGLITEAIGEYIKEISVLEILFSGYNFNKNYLVENSVRIYNKSETNNLKIDENDGKIISELFNNGRGSLLEISKKIGLSYETINKRLKELIKKKIIAQPIASIDVSKIGYSSIYIFVSTRGNQEKIYQKLILLCKNYSNVVFLFNVIGKYNYFINLEIDSISKLVDFIEKLKCELDTNLNFYDVFVQNESKYFLEVRRKRVQQGLKNIIRNNN